MINRRGLLAMLGWLPVGGFAEKVARVRVRPEPSVKRIELLDTHIAGFQYYDGMKKSVIMRLKQGGTLLLNREPDNEYDECAIAVHTPEGHKIGFVPRNRNELPASLADQGIPLVAVITELDPEAEPWDRVRIAVSMDVIAAKQTN